MFEWLRADVELVHDLEPADWFISTLEPWGSGGVRLASFMPDGFEGYARIFHPFELWDGRTTTYLRWSDVAAERGVSINAETHVEEVVGEEWEAIDGNRPAEGEIPEAVCACLVEVLAGCTRTPATCWFALWSGWGSFGPTSMFYSAPGPTRKEQRQQRRQQRKEEAEFRAIPQVEHHARTGRSYLLFRGPIDAACSFQPMPPHNVSPSMWWPDDRAWAVVTEIDGRSTYVGGARTTIDAIVGSDDLEAIEVSRQVRLD